MSGMSHSSDSPASAPQPPSLPDREDAKPARAFLLRAIALGVVLFLLLLGLNQIRGVLRERIQLRAEAVSEIRDSWGPDQTLVGPLIRIPYEHLEEVNEAWTDNGRRYERTHREPVRRHLWLAPQSLDASLDISTEPRYRGIYEAIVYGGTATLEAQFQADAEQWPDDTTILWEEAEIVVSLDRGASLRARPVFTLDNRPLTPRPKPDLASWDGVIAAPTRINSTQLANGFPFTARLELQGTGTLQLAPLGDSSSLRFVGDWAHPSFQGSPLPVFRDITDDGFEARWKTTEFARGFPSPSFDSAKHRLELKTLRAHAVGVALLQPVDAYRMAERALKYGILFIALVFAAFLLFEVLAAIPLHPVQYLLVGAALILFFLGFLALSEVIAIGPSYLLSASACILLISIYSRSVLRAGRRAWAMATGLITIYGYLYFVLRSESYALLAGTALLFAALAAIMLATRNLDWSRPVRKTLPDRQGARLSSQ